MTPIVLGESDRIKALIGLLERNKVEAKTAAVGHLSPTKGLPVIDREEIREHFVVFIDDDSAEIRETANALGDSISGRHAIVHLVHDLEPGSGQTISRLIEAETSTHRVGFLSGPMRSVDVLSDRPTSGVVASPLSEVRGVVADLLTGPTFRIYTNDDLRGAELSAAYVRVMAFSMGITHAADLGDSVRATLFARGVAETDRFARHCGATRSHGLAGTANLFLDSTLPGSEDFRAGVAVVTEGFDRGLLESNPQVASLLRLIDTIFELTHNVEAFILRMCAAISSGDVTAQQAVGALMSLPVLSE